MYQSKKELRKELEEVKERLRRETKYSGSCADRNVELVKANERLKKKINELNEAFIAMRDSESMKATTEISRIINETVKKMAEPTIGGKTIQEFMQTQAVKAKAETKERGDNGIIDVLDDLISAYHKGIEDLYHLREEAVNRVAAATGETKQETAVQRH